jgi:hypothetical protein
MKWQITGRVCSSLPYLLTPIERHVCGGKDVVNSRFNASETDLLKENIVQMAEK